jgi:hypothetical protein
MQEAEFALPGSEQDEVFAEHPHGERQVADLTRKRYGLPAPPQIFAARRIGADMREFRIFGGNVTLEITLVFYGTPAVS